MCGLGPILWRRSQCPRLGLPAAVTLHDYFLACPNGAYYRYRDAKPCALRPLSAACVMTQCDRVGYAHKAVRVARQIATGRAIAPST